MQKSTAHLIARAKGGRIAASRGHTFSNCARGRNLGIAFTDAEQLGSMLGNGKGNAPKCHGGRGGMEQNELRFYHLLFAKPSLLPKLSLRPKRQSNVFIFCCISCL